ncbi:MAG: glutamine synthetase beta-grasp domain-containing protein [Saprospiraceae bacterium]|nr:glutamine synthetase beta-grasp domain-containing protein [Saprospiraceae bacterium]MCB0623105.1 glutamine synthetase beta-grasp domain-containing protein [Saprospiraceae bacterium]MCB0677966.1 glutamine synthetase beta-grasp domain-containing protein [Saprospiraceae bacterium]MCB0679480.1 glutamine synthetase beta-grasp domain-containing protein [Saprospiraceae bacterium]
MAKFKFEYIWLDGYKPEPNLRSKTKVLEMDFFHGDIKSLPIWSFDGSSTQQAEGHSSDCLLKPVRVVPDPERKNSFLVMCEVLTPEGAPHATNTRALIEDDPDFWFGFEQEYVLTIEGLPLGFPKQGYPRPQGPYYCSVGLGNCAGRDIVEEHFDLCLDAGLDITGINAEVMLGQWEFQCFGKGAKRAADDLWLTRYLLHRVTEKHGVEVEFHPKPIQGDWNGSGMHTNFSNRDMREVGGKELIEEICDKFAVAHQEHIAVYGSDNEKRLTGLHETQSIHKFSYGVSDRGASIRIPVSTAQGWKGYLEDRRPASNADPYRVVARIIQTVKGVSGKTNGVTPQKEKSKN